MRSFALLLAMSGCHYVLGLERNPPIDPPLVDIARTLDGGLGHTCSIAPDGRLACWGRNLAGELGRGSQEPQLDDIVPFDGEWAQVSTGETTTCGLELDGSLSCWGENFHGQVGDGTRIVARAPRRIEGSWVEVSSGASHTCAIRSDRSLWCWGRNTEGQLGNGTQEMSLSPLQIQGEWQHVAAGRSTTCAIDGAGAASCWGKNDQGQLGTGDEIDSLIPVRIAGDELWHGLAITTSATGAEAVCGVTANRQLRCWGANNSGQLGTGDFVAVSRPTAVLIAGQDRDDFVEVTLGATHGCARTSDGRVFCWGSSRRGQLGRTEHAVTTPSELDSERRWTAVATGHTHTCVRDDDDVTWCIGGNGFGQLGVGSASPVVPSLVSSGWKGVAAGDGHTCAFDAADRMFCTGENQFGQLGVGTTDPARSFAKVNDDAWKQMDPGEFHTCAVRTDNTVWCWGANYYGMLGVGDQMRRLTPTQTRAGVFVATYSHSCALDGLMNLFCWGANDRGQIGNNTTSLTLSPVQIGGQWFSIAAGALHTCGLASDNAVYCWGDGSFGQIGNSANAQVSVPTPVMATFTPGTKVYAGGFFSCAQRSDSTVMCWGDNSSGQLGIGSFANRNTPQVVPGTYTKLSVGRFHVCGVRANGTLWCWGSNYRGQIGDGTRTPVLAPKQIGTETDWADVAAGATQTCAMKTTNGTLFCWGDNSEGQLGTGDGWSTELVQVP